MVFPPVTFGTWGCLFSMRIIYMYCFNLLPSEVRYAKCAAV
jgi:hypothetical protein